MPTQTQVQPGEANAGDGVPVNARGGRLGDAIVSELHGRFYEQNFRGRTYSGGLATLTSIAAATFTVATLGATCTPIIGLWNPFGSNVNAEIEQAVLDVIITALQNTGAGGFVWATSAGNTSATPPGNAPLNRKTLITTGSAVKDVSGVALAGLTNNLVARVAAVLNGGNVHNFASLDTAAGYPTLAQGAVENIDGSWIIPPGGILALLATTLPVAHSVVSALLWQENPAA